MYVCMYVCWDAECLSIIEIKYNQVQKDIVSGTGDYEVDKAYVRTKDRVPSLHT